MGNYTFKWEHPATEVYVTGTFDDWAKSVQLNEKDGVFQKTVELPHNDEKVLYKFVVDGNWVTNGSAPQEDDGHGIYNNVLHPDQIAPSQSAHIMSSAAPESTTAQLAAEQPKETPSDIPGSFIETPANEVQQFSVNPIPASEGAGNPVKLAPGEEVPHPSTVTENTVESTVQDDNELKEQDLEQAFGVNPLPATSTAGNPIKLAPGEKVPEPSEFTANNVNSHVTLDKESYEKGESLPPQLGPVVTPEKERGNANLFDIPGLTNNVIPESSLPLGAGTSAGEADPGFTIQSAHPTSTTATLAGQVPLEPRGVPEVVSESQKEAHVEPEASANPEAVQEKKELESELLREVPEEPATSENKTVGETAVDAAAVVASGLATAGAAAAGAAVVAGNKAAETYNTTIAPAVQDAVNNVTEAAPTENLKELAANTVAAAPETAAEEVPEPVSDSIAEAHASPEAAANAEAVAEKKDVEEELLAKVPESNETGEPAPEAAAAAAEPEAVAADTAVVPDIVKESIAQADQPAEATINPEAVQEKAAVENELAQTVQPTEEIADVAPTESAALSETAPAATSTEPAAGAALSALSSQSLSPEEPLKSSSESDIPETTLSVPPTEPAAESAEAIAARVTEAPIAATEAAPSTADPTTEENVAKTGLNAPAEQPAQTVATETGELAAQPDPAEEPSRDVSPHSKPGTAGQTEPTVTTGVGETTTAPATSGSDAAAATTETPATETKAEEEPPKPSSADGSKSNGTTSSKDDKKKNRRSFFQKIKDKFSGGHKA